MNIGTRKTDALLGWMVLWGGAAALVLLLPITTYRRIAPGSWADLGPGFSDFHRGLVPLWEYPQYVEAYWHWANGVLLVGIGLAWGWTLHKTAARPD